MASRYEAVLGVWIIILAKLLVTIPSYVYILDGYNEGVGKGASQKTLALHGLEEPFFISSCAVVSVCCSGGLLTATATCSHC